MRLLHLLAAVALFVVSLAAYWNGDSGSAVYLLLLSFFNVWMLDRITA